MQIWFNDEPLACADNLSVSALLTQLEQQQPGGQVTRFRQQKPANLRDVGAGGNVN